jgi:Putative Actinobacterial Holin-X, holin superfamily III
MVRSETPDPAGADQSLGDLVALAAKDASQLLRYEIDLAKTELRGDMKRVGLAGALGGVAAFVGCLVLVLLCIAFAFGLVALGIWTWAAFLIVAGTCVLLAGAAVGIAVLKLRGLSGLRQTRKSVTEGFGMLRRDGQEPAVSPDGDRPGISGDGVSRDGRRPQIAAHEAQ